MELGDRIAAWRKYRGLTQVHVAAKIDVAPSSVSMWESGDASPSVKHLDALIVVLAKDHLTFYGRVPAKTARPARAS